MSGAGEKTYPIRWQKQKDPWYFPFLGGLLIVVVLPYLIWRTNIINWTTWYGSLLYIAELYGIITTLLALFVAWKEYVPQLPKEKVTGKVDVLIPTYSEPLEVLEPVVLGATKIRGVNTVFVLDDGARSEVKKMAKRLGVRYLPRKNGLHAKAGNLNNGLKKSRAEFLITLDADHIPLPSFIEETRNFFQDKKLAFVQTPQSFYNVDSFLFRKKRDGRIWAEQGMFYNCLQPAKNNWNAAFFVGTSAMLRRQALDQIGGFATGTATEDIHTSVKLHAAGWNSIFLPKPLAFGLESESFKEYYKQRRRWAAGSLGLLFRSKDSPLRIHGLSIAQRLNYLSACLAHLQGLQKLIFFLVPVLTIFQLKSPIETTGSQYLVMLLLYGSVALLVTAAFSRGTYHILFTEIYAMACAFSHVAGLKGILKVQRKFAVSNKTSARNSSSTAMLIFWLISISGVVALVKVVETIIFDENFNSLLIYSALFTAINTAVLLSFLLFMHKYERSTAKNALALQGSLARYRYITQALAKEVAENRPRPLQSALPI